jgi:hypothetical protein
MVPTPRMNSAESLFDALVRKLTVGICVVMVDRLLRLPSSSAPPLMTDTAIGVVCSGCTRLVAVMVTVSSCPLSPACCATAGSAANRDSASGVRRRLSGWRGERVRWFMSSPSVWDRRMRLGVGLGGVTVSANSTVK